MTRKTVVFASGQLLTRHAWAPQIAALASDCDLTVADHGRDDTIAGMARRLLDAAPHRFHLVGHAMGGFTAFEVMRQAAERVQSLVLIATLASTDTPAQTERRQGYLRLVQAGDFERVVEERIPLLVHPRRRGHDALVSLIRSMAAETGAERFLAQQRAIMSRADSRPSLGNIAVPTLLIRGDHDAITSEAHQAEILAGIPGAHLAVIAYCGHLPTLEQPEATNRHLKDWLAV